MPAKRIFAMRAPIPLLPLLLALALAACGTPTHPENRGLESVHQPIVTRTDEAIDLATAAGGLPPSEDRRLASWLDALRVGYGDHVTLDGGTGQGDGVRTAIATIVARHGLLLEGAPPVTAGPIAAGTVRLIVSRNRAFVPGCPDWSSASRPFVDGSTDSNYGCAANASLAAMVADPGDLLAGRQGHATLGTRASLRALKAYNDLVPTGVSGTVKAESTKGQR
jgi:pilus assembly protein CpaD